MSGRHVLSRLLSGDGGCVSVCVDHKEPRSFSRGNRERRIRSSYAKCPANRGIDRQSDDCANTFHAPLIPCDQFDKYQA